MSQLKAFLKANGVSLAGITEKAELALLDAQIRAGGESVEPDLDTGGGANSGESRPPPRNHRGSTPPGALEGRGSQYGAIRCDERTFQKWRQKAELRSLLVNLDRVLWEGVDWPGCSMASILASSDVKLVYRKAIKLCHPDKLRSSSCDEALVQHGSKLFDTLKQAFTIFEKKEKANAAYAVPDCDL